jgi:hypothetical protein
MLDRITSLAPLAFLLAVNALFASAARAQATSRGNADSTAPRYLLQYKYRAGETITYAVEQLASIDTTIAGNNQKTRLRTKSVRSLKVEDVNEQGAMRFVHVVDHVDMWSEVGGRTAIHYASDQPDPPPPEYQQVAENIGKPISVITMNPRGIIVARQDMVQHPDLGLGGIAIPLPDSSIPLGYTWSQPMEVKVRLDDQRIKSIKTRELYRLEKVETGIATISLKTQVLTPLDDPRVKSQIVQRISQGEIRFDLEAGRLVSKQLSWDEQVLGFSGAESNMKYVAQFTEQLSTTPYTASKPAPAGS